MYSPLIFCKGPHVHIYYPDEENPHLMFSEPKITLSAHQEVKSCVFGTHLETRFFLLCTQNSVLYVDEKSLFSTCIGNEASGSSDGNLPARDCIFNQLLLPHMNNKVGLETNVTSVYKLGEKDRVYFCPRSAIIYVSISMDLILLNMMCDKSKKKCCISVFKIAHSGVEEKLFEKVPQMKIKCAVKETKYCDSENKLLLCMMTSSNFMSAKRSNDNVILPHELYVVLFSKTFELSTSPVLLFCDNSGCVFYLLLMENSESGHDLQHVLCDVGSSVVNVHCVQISHIKNFISGDLLNEISLYDEDHAENSPALVLISQTGKVVLFMVLDSKKAKYTVHITGPIVCSIQGNFLYHSNGKHIFSTKFCYDVNKKEVYVKSTIVKAVCVIQMEIVRTNDYRDEHERLLCRMKTGEMICVPTFTTKPLTISKRLKDLLYCVDQDRHTLSKLSQHHTGLNEIIEQTNISARLLNNYLLPETLQLLVIDVKIQNKLEETAHRHYLCFRIVNHTKMIISTDWSIVYYLIRGDSFKSICHTHKLTSSWKPQRYVNIRLPITEDINELEIFLGYNRVMDNYELKHIPIVIYIPVAKYELNSLDFLLDEYVYNQVEHGNSACVTKENETQLYTSQVVIAKKHIKTLTKANKHANSDDTLRFLLRNYADNEIQVNNSCVRLRNTSGSMIAISINLKDDEGQSIEENDEYIISLHSDNCALLACVRSAVLRMVQEKLYEVVSSTGSRSQQHVNQLKEVKSNLEEILVNINKCKPEELALGICQVYEQLRQVHI